MPRKLIAQIILLAGAILVLFAAVGTSMARPRRSHNSLSTGVERIYPNGMVFSYLDWDELNDVYLTDFSVESSEAFVVRDVGDQKLYLRTESTIKGPEESELPLEIRDEHEAPFWLVRWNEPIWPSAPLSPGTEIYYSEHGENEFYESEAPRPRVGECSAYNNGPEHFVDNNCRVMEEAPALSSFMYCSRQPESGKDADLEIYVDADIDIYDLNVIFHYGDFQGKQTSSASIEHGDNSASLFEKWTVSSFDDFVMDDQGDENPTTGPTPGDGYNGVGYYKPLTPLGRQFNGQSAKGSWKLKDIDTSEVELAWWCLDILAYRTVRFSQTSYQVAENSGEVMVTVELSERSMTQDTIVIVRTVPAPGSDQAPYTSKPTTIPATQSSANFKIPINDNSFADGNEDVALEVSVQEGKYGLSDDSFATIKILDDDTGGTPPPPPLDGFLTFLPVASSGGLYLNAAAQAPSSTSAASTWQELSNSATGSGLSANMDDARFPAVASDSYGQPFVVWSSRSKTTGEYEVFVKFWDGHRREWQGLGNSHNGTGLTDDLDGDSRRTAIAINNNSRPIVAWEHNVNGTWQIYAKRWNGNKWVELDGSASGGGISQVSAGSSATFPSIIVSQRILDISGSDFGMPIIAYRREASGGQGEIYVKYHDKKTKVWRGIIDARNGDNISLTSGNSTNPSIGEYHYYTGHSTEPLNIFVTWKDQGNATGNYDIFLKRAKVDFDSDGNLVGGSWSTIAGWSSNISNSVEDSDYSRLVIGDDLSVYLTWSEERNGKGEIYYKQYESYWASERSWREVESFASGGGISNTSGDSRRPTVSVGKQGYPHIVWEDDSSGEFEIYGKKWNGSSWQNIGSGSSSGSGISNNSGSSERPEISYGSNGVPYVAWMQGESGSRDIYFKWFQWWD